MVTERYAHILDDDRRLNAERLEKAFYAPDKGDEEKPAEDDKAVLMRLLSNPETVLLLKNLMQAV